ncbi:gyd domain protein [Halobacteriales archaeon QS_8_65_32]|nr:MAG: gyd domain protein [Halobacteriales archaeon QS_8_65_32]
MSTWISLVEVTDAEFQNLQELTSIWGDIRMEAEDATSDIEIVDTYALLSRYDFLLVFEAPDRDAVFELSLAVERQGLDMTTMEGGPHRALRRTRRRPIAQ